MTTTPKVAKYRRRPGAALMDGVDPAAIRAATLDAMAREEADVAAQAVADQAGHTVQGAPAEGIEAVAWADARRAAAGASVSAAAGPAGATSTDDGAFAHPNATMTRLVTQGDIASAAEVDSETQIARIRREGLTGRQLRMARRVAHKHGLAPTSDFDAVRLLRAEGIDPFARSNMLQLVPPAEGEAGASGPAPSPSVAMHPDGAANLPTAVPQHPAPTVQGVSLRGIKLPEDRASEVYKIQLDIARRRRRKMALLFARLAIFVFLPTALAGYYFSQVATPMYATNSEFVIQQADGAVASPAAGLFAGTGLATQQDSTNVQGFLQSRDAMLLLDADQGYKAHFSQEWIDGLQRLAPDATNEDAYALYSRNVRVGYDPTEGNLKMEVIAATPEASQTFSEALIGYAEERVDNLTQRLRADQMSGARAAFEEAEERVVEAQRRVLASQEQLGVLDPASETGSIMQQITQFELQLREKQLERDQFLSNPRPNEARVAGLEGEITRLEALVDDLRASMTESVAGEASLARVTGELRIAEADLATRQLLLQQAAQQLEAARIEANRQVRYMAVNVRPIAPDEPTYPRVFENTALAFLIFAGIYLMLSLTASVLREQVSA